MIKVEIKFLPKALNTKEAYDYLGSRQVLDDMREAGWINPILSRHRLTLWDRGELDKCYARLYAGEYPGEY